VGGHLSKRVVGVSPCPGMKGVCPPTYEAHTPRLGQAALVPTAWLRGPVSGVWASLDGHTAVHLLPVVWRREADDAAGEVGGWWVDKQMRDMQGVRHTWSSYLRLEHAADVASGRQRGPV
jgi:hypothetical protein